ncbi:hypothetical protein K7I13_02500 [Brucepastera parasyntrophica]|uniref:TolB family protein n=1 Tax=Brucepastera parasyntrophica TaxID=2880008 RepID=UPI00210C2DFE|nr:hypothetical protein [Brucepastera parasyntrophica]ULQ60206.1 hypothetical protein K7I13_02500 [Brucepastera parasyntrophica]
MVFPKRIRVLLRALCIIFFCGRLGADPIDVNKFHWQRIETEHYQIIFPDFMEEYGRYTVSALEYLFPEQQYSISPKRLFRYPVILHPDFLSPNGFVSIYPRRSVYYGTPIAEWPFDWFSLLSAHEGRHMFQYDALNRNTLRLTYLLMGDIGLLPFAPGWWFEGDAVVMETVLTPAGRGRHASFTAPFKALALDGKLYNYNKMLLGSYRDYVPNQYIFGYLMNTWLRNNYDMKAPEKLFGTFSKVPLPALGPYLGVKEAAGKGPKSVYIEMFAGYRDFWIKQIEALEITEVQTASLPGKSSYASYSHFALLDDGSIAAVRQDIRRGAEIILIKDGREYVLTDGYVANSFSSGGNFLAWDEVIYDGKFSKSRTRIMLYDISSGRKKTLVSGDRYLSPVLSPDGQSLAVIEWNADASAFLVLLDTAGGDITYKTRIPAGEIWTDMSFTADGTGLIYVSTGVMLPAGDNGKKIGRFSFQDETAEILIDSGFVNVAHPTESDGVLYYSSDISGIDTIYARFPDESIQQVMVRPIGAYFPLVSSDGKTLYVIDYADSTGTVIASVPVTPDSWIPLDEITIIREEFFLQSVEEEPGAGMLFPSLVPVTDIEAEKYSMFFRGSRIDGWGIGTADISNTTVGLYMHVGHIAELMEQNIQLDYDYGNNSLGSSYMYTYRGFRPDLSVTVSTWFRELGSDFFNETEGTVSINFPFGGGNHVTSLWSINAGLSAGGRIRNSISQLPVRASFSALAATQRQQYSVAAWYEIDPAASYYKEHRYADISFSSVLFGFTDRISLDAVYEKREEDDIAYGGFVRGYRSSLGLETVSGAATYSFPSLFPDLSMGAFLYIPKIVFNIFYDCGYNFSPERFHSSAGAEVLFYAHLLQLPVELNFGMRFAWLVEDANYAVQLLLVGIPLTVK